MESAQTLVTMLALALTQGGTFAAAYEIVKERGIFRRERAVNLSVVAYVFSKVLVLGFFGLFQVASVLFIVGLVVDMDFAGALFKNYRRLRAVHLPLHRRDGQHLLRLVHLSHRA